jgi:MFS transporter, ACS family, hexuronate transporter
VSRAPYLRWLLLGLVISAGILNYMDRQVIAVLKPMIETNLGWSDEDYGTLASIFQFSAALAFIATGWIVDRVGVRWANPLGVFAWSIAAMAHGWARNMAQFVVCRVALGATEAMGTPSAIKTIAAIFSPNQRSVGYGLSNAAGNLGAIVTPVVIPFVALAWGWRAAFVIVGLLGVVWAALWLLVTRGMHFEAAPAAVTSEPDRGSMLRERRTWAIAIAKLLSDQTWWLLLFWMPDFFHRRFGLGVAQLGAPLAVVYLCAALGSLAGGSVPARLLNRGLALNRVRKGALLVSALLVTPIPLALFTPDYRVATLVLGVALAGHQGFSTNLFALIADVVPRAKVGTVTSFGALVGNLGGMTILYVAGVLLARGYGYLPLFLVASVSYLLALGWIQLLLPRLERTDEQSTI